MYIILLDDLHTNVTRTNNVRDVAKQFVDEYLGTNDLAAVVYTSGRQESGQELTVNRRLLKAAIDKFQGQKLPSAGAEKLARPPAGGSQPERHVGRIAGDSHERGAAAGAVDSGSVRHAAGVQCPPVVGGHREHLQVARRCPGSAQGAALLQRRLRLRRLSALRHRARGFVDHRRREGSGGGRAAGQRQRVRHRSSRHEPVQRDDRDQRTVRLSTARVRHVPGPAAGTAAGAGEPDFALGRDRRLAHRELR